MTIAAWIFGVLSALPVSTADRDVDPEVKREQLETIADAIATASKHQKWPGSRRELALMLMAVAWHETHFALHVHAGNCRPLECDRGRARGLWQQHVSSTSTPAAWQELGGLSFESTTFAARQAARALVRSRLMCRALEQGGADWRGMTFAAYAGRGCRGSFSGLNARVASYSRWATL